MILILSDSNIQPSIDQVIDWLIFYDVKFVRLNGLNDDELTLFEGDLNQIKIETKFNNLDFSEIKSIWSFRWSHPLNDGTIILDRDIKNKIDVNQLNKHLVFTKNIFHSFLFYKLANRRWLGNREVTSLNKLATLSKAEELGLIIPYTYFSNKINSIKNVSQLKDNFITKASWEMLQLIYNDNTYSTFTQKINDELILNEETIGISLIQKKIDKAYEIRSFYIDNEFYSMAIFSQNNDKTKIDFRQYDNAFPNRNVPYNLPISITKKIKKLISSLKINTCSIDLIRDLDGKYIFLEINPAGQFGMTSKPCNYNLEHKIANFLINNDRKTT